MRYALLSLALLVAPAGAQEEVPESQRIFSDSVDVLVVNIETVVTDARGNRVPGLRREDFRLHVDGIEIPIDYFTEIREGYAQPSSPLDAVGEEIELPPAEPMPTSYLVFVDDFFAIGSHRNLVLEALAGQLSSIGPEDRVAVVAYDGKRAEMLVEWTADAATIRDGLREARKRRAGGPQRIAEARMFLSGPATSIDGEIDGSQTAGVAGSAFINSAASADAYFPLLERQISRLVDAATASLRGSLPPPGRKVALLVSGGWASGPTLSPITANEVLGRAGLELLERQGEILRAGLWYRPLVDAANLLGFTLYPVDAPGAGWTGPTVASTGVSQEFSSAERNVEFTLKQLAAETGGRPLLNGLRSRALEEAVEDTRSYYWLGFSAVREGSGLHHDVRVEVLGEGLAARSRESFVDLSRREEAARTVEAGLLLGEGEDMGDLDVVMGDFVKGKRRRTVDLPLVVRIPLDEVEILPVDGRLMVVLEVSIGARDKHDRVTDILTMPLQLQMREPPPPGTHAAYRILATVRRERHEFVVSVRDAVGGNVFIRRLPFDPKKKRQSPSVAADL